MIGSEMHTGDKVVFDFASSDKVGRWVIVNDNVMGGLSESEMHLTEEGTAVFEGRLSLENSGGFASVRSVPHAYDLNGYQGLVLRLRGDGRRYVVRFRTERSIDGPGYEAEFETVAETWVTVYVPFEETVPTFRGRRLEGFPKLAGERIRQIGLMIADKQPGPFRLEVAWIQAYQPKS
jgi:NADH dehydrogenase [ubiquinone] 1 alpha subcomplex assembly factor 1